MNLTLIRWGAIAVGVLFLALLVVGFIRDPFGWRKSKEAAEKVATAEATAEVAQETTRVLDTYHTERVVVQVRTAEAEAVVRELPGAETPLGDERKAALCAGLERVRGKVVC